MASSSTPFVRSHAASAAAHASRCQAAGQPTGKAVQCKATTGMRTGIGRTMRCRRVTLLLHDGWYVAIICAAKILLPLCSSSCTPYTSSYPLKLGAPENSHISINLPTCAKTPGEEVPFTLPCILSGQARQTATRFAACSEAAVHSLTQRFTSFRFVFNCSVKVGKAARSRSTKPCCSAASRAVRRRAARVPS